MPTFLENIKASDLKVVDSYFNKLADLTKVNWWQPGRIIIDSTGSLVYENTTIGKLIEYG